MNILGKTVIRRKYMREEQKIDFQRGGARKYIREQQRLVSQLHNSTFCPAKQRTTKCQLSCVDSMAWTQISKYVSALKLSVIEISGLFDTYH